MEALNNAMHWLYGTSWGAAYAIGATGRSVPALRGGALFGLGVWGASLLHLPAMRLAPPVWETDIRTIAPDLAFHLVYGIGVGSAFGLIE
jgi:uncharacterized membrane protein YagU involved in acid resistance